jgi:GntR family transcriptional regulator
MLEAEGLLERQRGKAMTIALQHQNKESKTARLHHLQPAIDQLVMAARQLELGTDEVMKAVRQSMEKNDD